jgi:hypothetical protein
MFFGRDYLRQDDEEEDEDEDLVGGEDFDSTAASSFAGGEGARGGGSGGGVGGGGGEKGPVGAHQRRADRLASQALRRECLPKIALLLHETHHDTGLWLLKAAGTVAAELSTTSSSGGGGGTGARLQAGAGGQQQQQRQRQQTRAAVAELEAKAASASWHVAESKTSPFHSAPCAICGAIPQPLPNTNTGTSGVDMAIPAPLPTSELSGGCSRFSFFAVGISGYRTCHLSVGLSDERTRASMRLSPNNQQTTNNRVSVHYHTSSSF